MESRKTKDRNIETYNRKRGNLEKRLKKEFIDHGIATIPCKVSGIDDIISSYSVKGYESLNSEFVEYVNNIADLVPEEYPIVLAIVGHKFTEEEQAIIKTTIEDDYAYDLGSIEEENKYHQKVFWGMVAGILLSGTMLTIFDWWETAPLELLFVLFWFFADTFFDYLFLEGRVLRKQQLKAARLACVLVGFAEEYNGEDYDEMEAKEVFDALYRKV